MQEVMPAGDGEGDGVAAKGCKTRRLMAFQSHMGKTARVGGLASTNAHGTRLQNSIQGEEDSEADNDVDSEADGSPD